MLKSASRIMVSALLIVLTFTVSAFAWTTDSYDVNVAVGEDNTYKVSETINVNFDTSKHGIFRYVPMEGIDGKKGMKIENIEVQGWEYDTYTESNNQVIQIGDPDITVRGRQKYQYEYTMKLYDDRNPEGDLLYIDLLPVDWETPIEKASVKLVLPKDIDKSNLNIYASKYGSADVSENISWKYDEAAKTLTIKGEKLPKGTGITVYCPLEEGYWVNPLNMDWTKMPFYIICIGIPLIVIGVWFVFGRDRKVVEVVEFYPPDDLSPAEIGYIIDGESNKKDIMSMVMYFAKKGYMTINQYEKDKFEFTKLKDIDMTEKMFARTLFNGFFPGKRTKIKMDDLDEDFGQSFFDSISELGDAFAGAKKQFETKSIVAAAFSMILLCIGSIVCIFLAAAYGYEAEMGFIGVFGAIIMFIGMLLMLVSVNKSHVMKAVLNKIVFLIGLAAGLVGVALDASVIVHEFGNVMPAVIFAVPLIPAMILCSYMYRRTDTGNKLFGRVLGFKNFIEAAELERINLLVDENPEYFYDILPYAYVLGLTDKWAEHFEHVKIVKPVWYTSYDNDYSNRRFNYWMFSRMMRSCEDNVSSNIKMDISSGSDSGGVSFGGGGGGFSGGGFGGGGGGSW